MIVVNLDVMMARRKMTLSQLSEKVDITLANLSILKQGQGCPVLHPGSHLRGPGLSAGGYSGICSGGRGAMRFLKGLLAALWLLFLLFLLTLILLVLFAPGSWAAR